MWLHFSKSEDTALQYTVYIIEHSLYSISHICICMTCMGLLPAWPPFRVFTSSEWHLVCGPSTSLSKDLRNLPQSLGPSLCSRVTKVKLPRFPFAFAKTAYPNGTTLPEYMVNISLTQSHWGPLAFAPLGHRLLMFHCLLHEKPRCQAGTINLITFITTVTYHFTIRDAGFKSTGFWL